jgi:hypothetical protein
MRTRDLTPPGRFRNVFQIVFLYGLIFFMPAMLLANAPCACTVASDTSKKDTSSYYEKFQPLINTGRIPFYGTWADYFSSYLKINKDSTFNFSWGFNGRSCWTAGKWERKRDTFYFIKNPAYKDTPGQNNCPLPDKLCYYKNKFYLSDSSGNLIKGKIPSPYMGKKSPLFKTFYFRDKRFNLDYFDSSYYKYTLNRRFRFGMGVNVVLQPIPTLPTEFSIGFIFSARYIFARKENSYLSLGLPLTLGFTGLRDTTSIDPHAGAMVDIPVIFNYNHAFGSSIQRSSRFEYFIGGGAAYHLNVYSVTKDPSTGLRQVNGFGPVANGGIRYSLGRYRMRDFELRFSYMKMIVASKTDIFGIGLILNF